MLTVIKPTDAHKLELTVHSVGKPMHNASLQVVGATMIGGSAHRTLWSPALANGSEPLQVEVMLPAGDGPVYAVLTWINPRPLKHHGHRLNLRTGEQEVWRWRWWAIALRRHPGDRWWQIRPARVRGRWVKWARPPLAEIPGG